MTRVGSQRHRKKKSEIFDIEAFGVFVITMELIQMYFWKICLIYAQNLFKM